MRTLIVLILSGCLGAVAAGPAELSEVRRVYLMPMSGGLDQYLANALTREGLFTIVVDPKQAAAVFSERVDTGFAAALDQLYPPPKPEAKKESAETQRSALRRSLGLARGTVFLVDVPSRQVIWSTFLRIEDTTPKALERAAQDIVKRLKKDLKEK